MHKIIAIGLLLFCVLFTFNNAESVDIKVFEIRNSSGDSLTTSIGTTVIKAKYDKLYGFTIMQNDGSKSVEMVVSIWDTVPDGTGGTINEAIAEAETVDETFDGIWYPYPKTIHTQVTVIQGANTDVLVYYGR